MLSKVGLNTYKKEAESMMATSKHDSRVVELFKSGRATPAQWAELVAAIGCAFDHDIESLTEINKAVGFAAAQKVCDDEEKARFLPERVAALAAASSEDERLRTICRNVEATARQADRAADRRWKATRRKLGIGGNRRRTRLNRASG
jgi:hypothetical protein